MTYFMIFLVVAYLAYLVYEKKRNDYYLSTFLHVVHVNGIRGKTSVCRFIDAGLRHEGYRVFTKTTGSTPFIINTNGVETLIKRTAPANIKEQIKIIKQAYKEKAEILILECMAVNPEYQKVTQEQIVKSNLSVITNVRHDHILDMGMELEEIAISLSNTIPKNGFLFTSDKDGERYFKDACKNKNTKLIISNRRLNIDEALDENISLAYDICAHIGIKSENFLECFNNYKKDFGSHYLFENIGEHKIDFLNLFSANDPTSTLSLLKNYTDKKNYEKIVFVYNNRADRADRLFLFCKYFFSNFIENQIFIVGQNTSLAKKLLLKIGAKDVKTTKEWTDILSLPQGTLAVGIGNIKNTGYDIITRLEKGDYHG